MNQALDCLKTKAIWKDWKPGIAAIDKKHGGLIGINFPSKRILGIDVDRYYAAFPGHEHANRWDYVFLITSDEVCVCVEIHPCTEDEIAILRKKKRWLADSVNSLFNDLYCLRNCRFFFYWVPNDGKIKLPKHSKHKKILRKDFRIENHVCLDSKIWNNQH